MGGYRLGNQASGWKATSKAVWFVDGLRVYSKAPQIHNQNIRYYIEVINIIQAIGNPTGKVTQLPQK